MAASRSQYVCAFAALDADGVAEAQAVAAAGPLVLDGDMVVNGVAQVATAPVERQIGITSTGEDVAITFTVTGTNASGAVISETVAGADTGVAVTTLGFTTVTSVVASDASDGDVSVGTTAVAMSPWIPLDTFVEDFQVSFLAEVVAGTPTFTLQKTYDELLQVGEPAPLAIDVTDFTGEITTQDGAVTEPVSGLRIRLTTGTGTVRFMTLQGGIGA